jgi:hypothetical protein
VKVIDPGHVYELDWLDVEPGSEAEDLHGPGCRDLTFVKREDDPRWLCPACKRVITVPRNPQYICCDGHESAPHPLTLCKKLPSRYPGNVGHHPGTNMQEVLRALIDRVKYLDAQVPDPRNKDILSHLRMSIWLLEMRAAQRHGRPFLIGELEHIEERPVCGRCGHIGCEGGCHDHAPLP